jgi:hypothetical protein
LEVRKQRRIEREMMESRGVFKALEPECHTLTGPHATIESHRARRSGRSCKMQEVLIFRALNESAQDCVRISRRARRAEAASRGRLALNCATGLIAQPRANMARMESAQDTRIQETPGFKGFLALARELDDDEVALSQFAAAASQLWRGTCFSSLHRGSPRRRARQGEGWRRRRDSNPR